MLLLWPHPRARGGANPEWGLRTRRPGGGRGGAEEPKRSFSLLPLPGSRHRGTGGRPAGPGRVTAGSESIHRNVGPIPPLFLTPYCFHIGDSLDLQAQLWLIGATLSPTAGPLSGLCVCVCWGVMIILVGCHMQRSSHSGVWRELTAVVVAVGGWGCPHSRLSSLGGRAHLPPAAPSPGEPTRATEGPTLSGSEGSSQFWKPNAGLSRPQGPEAAVQPRWAGVACNPRVLGGS